MLGCLGSPLKTSWRVLFLARPRRAPGGEDRVSRGFPGGRRGCVPLHLARQAIKRNGQNGSTMHRVLTEQKTKMQN